MKNIYIITLLVSALSACENSTQNNDETPDFQLASESGSITASPQGINENLAERRKRAREKDSRKGFRDNRVKNREIRSYDGSSNNPEHPNWGASFTQLQRIGSAAYSDGISSLAGAQRKGAREISNIINIQDQNISIPNRFGTSDFLWQWGQFVDHDMDLTDGNTDEVMPILVPAGDLFFDPDNDGNVTIEFNRANYDPETGFSVDNPRQQENEITSWIDGSMVYGSDEDRAKELRVGDNRSIPQNQ